LRFRNLFQIACGVIIFTICISLSSALYAEPIVADHNSVLSFDQIPASVIETVGSNARIFYARSSHGYQIIVGIGMLYGENPLYQSPYFYHQGDDLGYAEDTTWVPATRLYLDAHPECNVAMFSWCGGVSSNTEEGINIYLSKMTELEQTYPNVTFVYMTGHLDGSGIDGNLYARNNQIRAYCRANDKVLFDFADIESYDPDGNFYPDETDACNWCYDWCAAHDCPACGDCPHSHCFNCYRKGKAFWWMMARMYGWGASGPAEPSNCSASDSLCEYVQLEWSDNADNEDGFIIERDWSFLADLPVNSESYNDLDAIPGLEYNYTIKAYNENDTVSSEAGTGMRRAKPGSPTLINPADGEDNLSMPISLEWDSTGSMFMCQIDDNVDFVEPLAVGIDYLSSPRTEVSENLQRGRKYYWRIRAGNDCGWGEWSDVFEFSTEYLRIRGTVFSQTDTDTIIHGLVELYRYGDSNPFKVTETYCVATGKKDPGDSLTMYQFDSLLQDSYSIRFMDYWVYDGIELQDNYAGDSLNIKWTGLNWTSVEEIESGEIPESFSLFQNYPNPFNPRTRIEFSIPEESYVTIEIFNIKGEMVKTLVQQRLSAGNRVITWDGEDDSGNRVSSGIYFYRLICGGFVSTKKMMLIK
jgi:hypothetical protein